MALKTRIDPIERELKLFLDAALGPEARSAMLAEFAYEAIEEAKQQNRQILGAVPPYNTFVDGKPDAPFSSVKPEGEIRAEFELVYNALAYIHEQLQRHSPVLTGRYAKSHELFADGVEAEHPDAVPPASEYIFINSQPYARKIEGIRSRGGVTIRQPLSPQAPDGVYQAVAHLARQRFGNTVSIDFTYRTAMGGTVIGGKAGDRSQRRNPAIVVKLRG